MYIEARKIHIIEAVLKANNEETLRELEAVIERKNRKSEKKKTSIYDFVGIFSKEESKIIKQAIEETSETIHPDDWR